MIFPKSRSLHHILKASKNLLLSLQSSSHEISSKFQRCYASFMRRLSPWCCTLHKIFIQLSNTRSISPNIPLRISKSKCTISNIHTLATNKIILENKNIINNLHYKIFKLLIFGHPVVKNILLLQCWNIKNEFRP